MKKSNIITYSPVFALLWSLCFVASVYSIKNFEPSKTVGLSLIFLNVMLFVLYIYSTMRSFKYMDEVKVRIHFEAVVMAFALTLTLIMSLGLYDIMFELNQDKHFYLYLFPILFLFYFIGLFISNLKYK